MSASLVGSEMCIRDRLWRAPSARVLRSVLYKLWGAMQGSGELRRAQESSGELKRAQESSGELRRVRKVLHGSGTPEEGAGECWRAQESPRKTRES
eukprot:12648135-Alexandrium_andersonii.AAC.1